MPDSLPIIEEDETTDPTIDKSNFSLAPYSRRVEKPWGHELHLVPPDAPYMLKLISINDGHRLSLQLHDMKRETWTLMSGRAAVLLEDSDGTLHQIELEIGVGYTCALFQQHRLLGIENGVIIEASTPEIGTTKRLDDDYARPHETEERRKIERDEL